MFYCWYNSNFIIMEESMDTFAWTHKLECPPTLCNDLVKTILRKGLVGFLWDDLADLIFTSDKTKIIRKNVLLYQLKQGLPNKVVQCAQNISQIKSNRNDLKNQISKLEEEYEQLDFAVRQRVQELQEVSSKHSQVKVRKQLLKMKYDQTNTQLRDCNDMRLVCQHLMPNSCKDLDPKIIIEMSDVVTSLWAGANKRQVWDIVSNNLNSIEVTTLWHHLYQNLAEAVETLIKSENIESLHADEKHINVDVAKIYGQHICMVSKQLLYRANANNHRQSVVEFIQKIEAASNNSTDISEWLALALEVRKLETEQRTLQEEIDKIQKNLDDNNMFAFDLIQLTSEIQDINTEIVEYMQDIQQSLNLLKSSPMHLTKTKEKICLELERILALRCNGYDSTWLNNDLNTELEIFHNTLDLNALRKIMLKGNVGVYRYIENCFNKASLPISNSQTLNIMCYFPMIQTPIYSLIECYKNLVLQFFYKRFESLKVEDTSDILQMPVLTYEENNSHTIKLLNLSKAVNKKTNAEIDEFNEILNVWIRQTVQKVMEIIEKTVDDATFPNWVERYNLLLYILQNPKQC